MPGPYGWTCGNYDSSGTWTTQFPVSAAGLTTACRQQYPAYPQAYAYLQGDKQAWDWGCYSGPQP